MMKAVLVAALTGCVLVPLAQAQEKTQESASLYPSRPVTFVVPFAPGGSTGLIARLVGQKLEQRLGKPFIIDHRAGGGGVIGVTQVGRGTRDGYSIMRASSTALAINVNVRKTLPYDPRKDITPVALLARMPYVLVVNPDLPVQSVADLVKLAKSKPGQLSFASVGPGTIHHLNAEMFKSIFDIDVVHVPYKGSAPALQDVVGGHVQFMFVDAPPAKALIEIGKLRALRVTTVERAGILPSQWRSGRVPICRTAAPAFGHGGLLKLAVQSRNEPAADQRALSKAKAGTLSLMADGRPYHPRALSPSQSIDAVAE